MYQPANNSRDDDGNQFFHQYSQPPPPLPQQQPPPAPPPPPACPSASAAFHQQQQQAAAESSGGFYYPPQQLQQQPPQAAAAAGNPKMMAMGGGSGSGMRNGPMHALAARADAAQALVEMEGVVREDPGSVGRQGHMMRTPLMCAARWGRVPLIEVRRLLGWVQFVVRGWCGHIVVDPIRLTYVHHSID